MTVREWLDADIGVVLQRGRAFLRWWMGELAEAARPLLRVHGRRGPRLLAERSRDGVYRLWRAGAPAGQHAPNDRPVRAALALPPDAALVRQLSRPALSERDLVRMTVLDIDRLTPFAKDEVYYDVAVLPAAAGAPQRDVRLAVVPRNVADAVLDLARLERVEPDALLAIQPDARIDFLPAVRVEQGRETPRRGHAYAWMLVAVLAAANVGAAVWRDVRATRALQAMADAQSPVAATVRQARQQVARLEVDAALQAAARRRGEPLRVLNAASAALPDGAWVQRLSWDGQEVRLTGQAKEGVDSLGALRRAPAFADAHPADAAASVAGAGFDIASRAPPPTGSRS